MNKNRIEKLWETLRSDEFHISHEDALIELCEALMDEEEHIAVLRENDTLGA